MIFGKFKEADGNVTHTFVITNQGDAPLVITRVIASMRYTQFGLKTHCSRLQQVKSIFYIRSVNRPRFVLEELLPYTATLDEVFILSIALIAAK